MNWKELMLIVILLVIAGLAVDALLSGPRAQSPCGTWGAPQIAPPRVGIPDRVPLACITVDGTLRCE